MLLWLSALLRLISCSVGNVWYCVTGIRLSLQYAALKGGYNAISCIELFTLLRVGLLCVRAHSATRARAAQRVSFMVWKSLVAQQYLLEKNVSKDVFWM